VSASDAAGAPVPIEADSSHAAQMVQLLNTAFLLQALYAATELGLADLVTDGAKTPDDLARATGAHGPSLHRLLRMLAGNGVFREEEGGRFTLTPLAATLRVDSPVSVRDWVRWVCGPDTWAVWGDLLHAVRTGEPAFAHTHGKPYYAYLADHPDLAGAFGRWMTAQSRLHNAALVSAYDFSRFGTVVDVGGGQGATLAAILEAYPAVRGILLDQPTVVAQTPPLATAEMAGRCTIVGGDARQSVPAGGDCYVVKRLLMEQPDDGAIAILRNCAEAMTAGGRVLVVEMVIPPANEPAAGKTYDVIMLATFSGGRIRTEAELRTLFAAAGLALTSVIPTSPPNFIVEGVRG